MINGVIAQKLQTLDGVLNELKSLGKITTQQVDSEWRTQRAIERDLQVLVEFEQFRDEIITHVKNS